MIVQRDIQHLTRWTHVFAGNMIRLVLVLLPVGVRCRSVVPCTAVCNERATVRDCMRRKLESASQAHNRGDVLVTL